MKLILLRHGDPNYKQDCLTPRGREQAKALAEVLRARGVDKIYASTKGRATETASYTSELLGLPITPIDWIREIQWGMEGSSAEERRAYHIWHLADTRSDTVDLLRDVEGTDDVYYGTLLEKTAKVVAEGLNGFLSEHGYTKIGPQRYAVSENASEETVALFAHAGSLSIVLHELLGLPIYFIGAHMKITLASITEIVLQADDAGIAHPIVSVFNEHRHVDEMTYIDTPESD